MNILDRLYMMACLALHDFIYEEDGAVDIVAIVVMIGIAVVLAVLFRTQIEGLLNTIFGTITQNASNAVN